MKKIIVVVSSLFSMIMMSCVHRMDTAPTPVSLVGKWTGTVTQNGGGTSNLFTYEMTITEHSSTMVMGNAYIRDSKDKLLFAHKNLMGTFSGNAFHFDETDIMHQNTVTGVQWLLLSCKTTYTAIKNDNGTEELNGTWSSGSYSGNISLTKQ
jgi:hypothetical protein